MKRGQVIVRCLVPLFLVAAVPASAQDASPPGAAAEAQLFAVEIRTGPRWDPAKPPQEQAFFREHSANLRRLRESGNLVIGARYGDKGLIVLSAPSLPDAKAMMDQDPSIAGEVFVYEAHPFNVFYAGSVQARPRR